MKNKRWYDYDPVIALAISLLEKSDDRIKNEISIYIIKKAKDFGIKNEDDTNTSFNFVWQRQSDASSDFHNALEYMKKMNALNQKELSLEILKRLNK